MDKICLDELEKITGCEFKNKKILLNAVTHSSYANEKKKSKLDSNERLEFLGDAVLELCVSDFLYNKYSNRPEGELTKLRAQLVCESSLAILAKEINLGKFLLLSKGEEQTGGRNRDSILSDALEALIGAIYIDSGREKADDFIIKRLLCDIERRSVFIDAKSILQEKIQEQKKQLVYEIIDASGPDHEKVFTVRALLDGVEIGYGKGPSKKRAEQEAAYNAILNIE